MWQAVNAVGCPEMCVHFRFAFCFCLSAILLLLIVLLSGVCFGCGGQRALKKKPHTDVGGWVGSIKIRKFVVLILLF